MFRHSSGRTEKLSQISAKSTANSVEIRTQDIPETNDIQLKGNKKLGCLRITLLNDENRGRVALKYSVKL
jgi:hypothetical protein